MEIDETEFAMVSSARLAKRGNESIEKDEDERDEPEAKRQKIETSSKENNPDEGNLAAGIAKIAGSPAQSLVLECADMLAIILGFLNGNDKLTKACVLSKLWRDTAYSSAAWHSIRFCGYDYRKKLYSGDCFSERYFEFLEEKKIFSRLRNLSLFGLEDLDVITVASALKGNKSLINFNLSSNLIGDEGAIALADLLRVNTSLTLIDISSNKIGDEGLSALANVLRLKTYRIYFNISSNQIGDVGAVALCGALLVNAPRIHFDLSGNQIGEIGLRALACALQYYQLNTGTALEYQLDVRNEWVNNLMRSVVTYGHSDFDRLHEV